MTTKEKLIGGLFTAIAIALNFLYMGLPVIFLNIGLVISFIIWANFRKRYSRKLSWLYLAGILIQVAHFMEEWYYEFYKRLPSIINANPWTSNQFITFNVIWLTIFLIAAIGTLKSIRLSFLVVWFFILVGCIGNGVLHIGSSLLQKEYFPGAMTAFPLLIIGVVIVREIIHSSSNSSMYEDV